MKQYTGNIVFFDRDWKVASIEAYNLNEENDEKTEDVNEFIFDDELRACFQNCSLDGDNHIQISGLRGQHVRRYITDGRRTDIQREKLMIN